MTDRKRLEDEERRVWLHTVDYLRRDGERAAGKLLHRGYFLHNTPRLMLLCRLLGHRPVVDGTKSRYSNARWVCCDRCGVRPRWQGALDPSVYSIGDRYSGPFDGEPVGSPDVLTRRPGPWPAAATGAVGAELVVGGHPHAGVEVKVGNAGSEHTLAAHLLLGKLGGLYVHTERHGSRLQRRLNPTGYDSRVTGVGVHNGFLHWEVWARRDGRSARDPRWMAGAVRVDPRDLLLGERRYWYENVGEPQPATIRLAHGDDHDVLLQLQSQTHGRKRGRWTRTWCVDVHVMDRAISTRSDNDWKDGLVGWGVDVPDRAVEDGRWIELACDLAAARVTEDRARSIYHHTTGVPE